MSAQAALASLLLPPIAFVWAVLAALGLALARRRRAALWLGAPAAVALLGLATPFAAGSLRAALATADASVAPVAAAPAAIVVLGGDQAPGGADAPGPLSLERLRAGAALARATGLPVLVTGGPLSPGARPIAEIMADSLRDDFGVEARWVEPRAPNTRANARLSARALRAAGVEQAHVVTHAWHLARARAAFAAEGFATAPAPVRPERWPTGAPADFVPRPDHWGTSWLAIREWAGMRLGR